MKIKDFAAKSIYVRAKEFLDAAAYDEIFTPDELAEKLNTSVSSLRSSQSMRRKAKTELKPYQQFVTYPQPQTIWGNPKAIIAFRKLNGIKSEN